VEVIMETRNVTLSLPEALLHRAKRVAVERHTSISGLLVQALTAVVEQEEGYDGARQRYLQTLHDAPDLATQGRAQWRREDLHER
jgi:hypothetical protein